MSIMYIYTKHIHYCKFEYSVTKIVVLIKIYLSDSEKLSYWGI